MAMVTNPRTASTGHDRPHSGLALLIGSYCENSQLLQVWAYVEFKLSMMVVAYTKAAQDWLRNTPVSYRLICVDLDHFISMNTAIEVCLSLRNEQPTAKLVLLSHDTARDDFGSERSSIADVTLRKPVSFDRFVEAIEYVLNKRSAPRVQTYQYRDYFGENHRAHLCPGNIPQFKT